MIIYVSDLDIEAKNDLDIKKIFSKNYANLC